MNEKKEIPLDSVSTAIEDIENNYEEIQGIDETTLPQAIRELRNSIFKENPLKISKISHENRKGMTGLLVLNNFFETYYGYRIKAYDDLISDTMARNMSIDATGLLIFNDALGKINATFTNVPQEQSILKKKLF